MSAPGIPGARVTGTAEIVDAYGHFCRRPLARLLHAVRLDAVFERAEGDYLWQRRGGELVRVLDLVGGYGANLFGHHHPELVAEARRLLDEGVPFLAQGSIRGGAARLAEALCSRLGDYAVIFTNSGTETVEAALKHLLLERRRRAVWAVKGAFHGKTMGSLQLTWSQRQQYDGLGLEVRFLDPEDPSGWEEARRQATERDDVAGAFVEPILGEGGVRPLSPDFTAWISRTCRLLGIPIVVDEIQTGFGRTGTFLASEPMGLHADYLCLSKALGGGLAKIGALLIRRERFIEEFALSHTSTFAEDDWSCLLALKALDILERDALPQRCAELGTRLLGELESLRSRFPGEIREVRGRGLMVGVELADQSDSSSSSLRAISSQGYLGWLAAAYLFNAHNIRVAPTLSQPFTLRIEPSAFIEYRDLEGALAALETMGEALKAGDAGHLLGFLAERPLEPVVAARRKESSRRDATRNHRRVAFVMNFSSPDQLALFDPSLASFSPTELARLIERTSAVIGPTVSERVNVRSPAGEEVHLIVIGLPMTAQQIADRRRENDLDWIIDRIDAAVTLAKDEGCQAVGLGGYTSSVTASCLRVRTKGIALTSGNSLAVGMGIQALRRAAERSGIELARARLGVVGLPGNIATTYATMMAPAVRELVLVARNQASPRVQTLVDVLRRANPQTAIVVGDSPAALKGCSLIASATVGAPALIHPAHLGEGPLVICDMSVPPDVAPSVHVERRDATVIEGGIVRLAGNHDFGLRGVALPPGHTFACLAETLLMGLEPITSHLSYGAITSQGVERTMALAEKHGFVLGDIDANRRPERRPGS